jgi:DNA polymerase-3 subunit delta'
MDSVDLPPVSIPLQWHVASWSELQPLIERERLPHALLLAGPRHIGKERFALALARRLLCQRPADGLNCGECHACALSASGGHGDMRWLAPEDKSRVIKIDQVREVVAFANKTAGFGDRKVIVLTPADSMNTNAANALLKSLEEPAADTYFILVCHAVHGVPATIRSRCRILRLPVPLPEDSLQWLDNLTGERAESQRLLALAEGRPLLAETLYREGGADLLAARQAALQGLLDGSVTPQEMVRLLEGESTGQALVQLASGIGAALRALDAGQLHTNRSRGSFRLLDEILDIQRAVAAGSNPNHQLLLEALLAKLWRLHSAG